MLKDKFKQMNEHVYVKLKLTETTEIALASAHYRVFEVLLSFLKENLVLQK